MPGLNVLHGCRTIQLSRGQNTLIDEADFRIYGNAKWCAIPSNGTYYASRTIYLGVIDGKQRFRIEQMHRSLIDAPAGSDVDHRDGDPLNNTRDNLRLATRGQNMHNRRKAWGRSRFKGVTPRENGKFRASIDINKKRTNLGTFATEEDAARAYDAAAKRLCGEFALTNRDLYGDY